MPQAEPGPDAVSDGAVQKPAGLIGHRIAWDRGVDVPVYERDFKSE